MCASLTSPGHVVSDGEGVCVVGSAIGGVSRSILPLTLSLVSWLHRTRFYIWISLSGGGGSRRDSVRGIQSHAMGGEEAAMAPSLATQIARYLAIFSAGEIFGVVASLIATQGGEITTHAVGHPQLGLKYLVRLRRAF